MTRLRTLSLRAALLGMLGCGSTPPPTALPTLAAAHLAAEPRAAAPAAIASVALAATPTPATQRWSEERAQQWYDARGWLVGVNYVPSTAVNQLEMWQAESFDPLTIERELGWAESLGFTSLRVFLHDLAWKQDASGFEARIDEFLGIAQKHQLGVMLVIFDGVWNPLPKPGKQPLPRPHVHNSGWVQSPGSQTGAAGSRGASGGAGSGGAPVGSGGAAQPAAGAAVGGNNPGTQANDSETDADDGGGCNVGRTRSTGAGYVLVAAALMGASRRRRTAAG